MQTFRCASLALYKYLEKDQTNSYMRLAAKEHSSKKKMEGKRTTGTQRQMMLDWTMSGGYGKLIEAANERSDNVMCLNKNMKNYFQRCCISWSKQ